LTTREVIIFAAGGTHSFPWGQKTVTPLAPEQNHVKSNNFRLLAGITKKAKPTIRDLFFCFVYVL
jgi:hypothetical protein